MPGWLFSTEAQALEIVALIGAPARPVSSNTLPLPCRTDTSHLALCCSPVVKLENILYAHGLVTTWSKFTTTMPWLHAWLITGLRAVGDPASIRMAAGFLATIACSELI